MSMSSALAIARQLWAGGRTPVPVPTRSKAPRMKGWATRRPEESDLVRLFGTDPVNVGVVLGPLSGDLVDLDLDDDIAVELADQSFPSTGMVGGRSSRPRSHRFYICPGIKPRKFVDPRTREILFEIRAARQQSVVHGIHPDGDTYALEGDAPTVMTVEAVEAAATALYLAILTRRYGSAEAARKRNNPGPVPAFQTGPPPSGIDSLRKRATAYIQALPCAISGQNGHDRTFRAACALVWGFGLSVNDALQIMLDSFNPRCEPPWSEQELLHKLTSAAECATHEKPFGHLRDYERRTCADNTTTRLSGASAPPESVVSTVPAGPTECPDNPDECIALGEVDPVTGRLVLSPRRTLPTARAFIRRFCAHPDGVTLLSYAGMLFQWRGSRFVLIEDEFLRKRLMSWLHEAVRYVVNRSTGQPELAPFEANPATVKQALETLRAEVHLPAQTSAPCWLDSRRGRPSANELLVCKSSLVHLPTGARLPPTPALFTMCALDFDYEPTPSPPRTWFAFLQQLFGDDLAAIGLLQEWMGYCLISDTSLQKMLVIVGPRRSGKGTIGRVLTGLVGGGNVVGPTATSLAGTFGLQPLIDKSLAIVSDARFSGEGMSIVVERLLCISGEDRLTIDRKYLGSVSLKLGTRFMFLTNELPRLTDASTALAGRFLVLQLRNSFYGSEDPSLTEKLFAELPGILVWAIEGWKRLKARGHFSQPDSGAEAIRDMEDLASPVGAFVRERCVVGAGYRAYVDELYREWRGWCEEDGRTAVTTKQAFGRDLAAAVPGVVRRRGTLSPFYEGIGIKGAVE